MKVNTLLITLVVLVGFVFSRKPNLVYVLTDDQDILLGGMSTMTFAQQLFIQNGLTFTNGFVSSPVCCVSRATMVSGRYVHNTGTINNSYSGGCSNSTWQSEAETRTYAVYLRNAGYATFYAGKYLNQYGSSKAGGVSHIPPGWTNWNGLVGNSKYYNYTLSVNGIAETHGDNYENDYLTDVISNKAIQFLDSYNFENYNSPPFLMVLATPAAHAPFTPAPQYVNTSAGQISPRTPNWNYTNNNDKHELMRSCVPMNQSVADQSDLVWRNRLGTLRSVDDMIKNVYNKLDSMNLLNNTYWFYMSDHGFHLGQFGMSFDKRQLYETDIRIPFYASGMGDMGTILQGESTTVIADNVDIAPTLVELGSNNVPEDFDGRSLVPWLFDNNVGVPTVQNMYYEYDGDGHGYDGIFYCGSGITGVWSTICDSWNNSYSCVREIDSSQGQINGTVYCMFRCWGPGHEIVECQQGTPESQGEFYNLDTDPWSLKNAWSSLTSNDVNTYESQIKSYQSCAGQTECNALR